MNKMNDVAEWLLLHKSGLEEKINEQHNPAYHLFPPSFLDIYLDNYTEFVISLVKREIETALPLNPEEINLIITKDWLTLLLGSHFLKPQ